MERLTAAKLKDVRVQLLAAQGGRCPLCQGMIKPEDAVVDHDHKTGVIRAVLHRGCNSMLGKVENHLPMSGLGKGGTLVLLAAFLASLVPYLLRPDKYTSYIYPTHRTVEEVKERAKKRRKARTLKAKNENPAP